MCPWNKAQAERISCKSHEITGFLSQSLLFCSPCLNRICIWMRIFNVFTLTCKYWCTHVTLSSFKGNLNKRCFCIFFLFVPLIWLQLQSTHLIQSDSSNSTPQRCFEKACFCLSVFVDPNREIHNVSNSLGALCRKGLRWADKPEPRAVKISKMRLNLLMRESPDAAHSNIKDRMPSVFLPQMFCLCLLFLRITLDYLWLLYAFAEALN